MGCSNISGQQIRKEMAEFGAIMTGQQCEALDGEAALDTVKQLCAHAGGKPKSATGGVFFDGPSFMKFWSALKDAGFSDVSKPTNTRRILVKDGVRVELDTDMRTYKSKMTEALAPSQKRETMKSFTAESIRREVALVEQIADISREDCEEEGRDFLAIMANQQCEALDPAAKQARDMVLKLAKKVDDLFQERNATVKALQKLGYDQDVTDWLFDAWGSPEGHSNKYIKQLLSYIESGKR